MTIAEFQERIDALREKAGMRPDILWPIVLDSDEMGEIWLREDGRIFLSDKLSNWVESHLTLEQVSNLRFKADPNGKREIYVNFTTGDCIKMHTWKKNTVVYTAVTIQKTEENAETADALKAGCECYDNLRGNTIFVNIRKTEK